MLQPSQACHGRGTGKTGKDKDKKDKQDFKLSEEEEEEEELMITFLEENECVCMEQEVYGLQDDEHTTNTERVLRVHPALVHRSPRMSGVLLACTFMRRTPRTVLCMHKNPDAPSEWTRMKNIGSARSTNE